MKILRRIFTRFRNRRKLTEHFDSTEFLCKCGCGQGGDSMNMTFVHKLERARTLAETSFVITSGYRCAEYNRKVGGTSDSDHLVGNAADIAAQNSTKKFAIVNALMEEGFTRIGDGEDFVHVDNSITKAQKVMWYYRNKA